MSKSTPRRQRPFRRLRLAGRRGDRHGRRRPVARRRSWRCRTASAVSRASSGRSPGRPRLASRRSVTVRHETAAAALGAGFRSLDRGDYPLVDGRRRGRPAHRPDPRARAAASFSPTPRGTRSTPITRSPTRRRCRRGSSRAGRGSRARSRRSRPPELLLFEPHQPELCGFVPTTFLDITPVWEKKVAAMEAMGAQGYLRQYYSERAEHRANHARRISGRSEIRYRRGVPARDPGRRRHAVSDYRPPRAARRRDDPRGGRRVGIVDLALTQVVPGSRVAGPARIAACAAATTRWCTPLSRMPSPGRRARADERRPGADRSRRRAAGDAGTGARGRRHPGRRRRARSRRARRDRPADLGAVRPCAGSDEGRRRPARSAGRRRRRGDPAGRSRGDGLRRSDGTRRRARSARCCRSRSSAPSTSARCVSGTPRASSRTT